MKRLYRLLPLIVMVVAMAFAPEAYAKKEKKSKEEKENDEVVAVTMKDGSVENGKIATHWTYMLKTGFNTDFKIKTDDGRELKLTTADVDSLYFPLRTDTTMFKTYRPYKVPTPKIGNTGKMSLWMCGEHAKGAHARIVKYMAWTDVMRGTRSTRELRPVACICFDNDSVAYPFYYYDSFGFNMSIIKKFLKESQPEFVKYMETYFKAHKQEKKDLGKRPEIMLDVYEEYLKSVK